MKLVLDIPLEKFRYSLVGDGFLLEEVKNMTDEQLAQILRDRIYNHIEIEYHKTLKYGLLTERGV